MITTTLAFGGLVAAGETHVAGYPVFAAIFLLTSLLAPTASDEPAPVFQTTRRRFAMGATMMIGGAAIALGMIAGVRSAYWWLTSGDHSTALIWSPRVGFSSQMDLGALEGLLDSDTIVLRARGPRVDYLRGAVLDFYAAGQWIRSDRTEIESAATYSGDGMPRDEVEIAAVSERTDRFFVPLAARLIVASPADVLVDGAGAMKREAKQGLNVARFMIGARDRAEPTPPGPSDLQLPRGIRPQLAGLAGEWTGGAATTTAKLEAIERRLRTDFHYARTFQRLGGMDPVLDFLLVGKSGHCEYFATAMALVARAAGIPARMVAGYRVGEQSPFGYYVVRERNAHAWVEAWIPGQGWTTRDPTPDTYLPQNREHRAGYAASMADATRVAYDDLTDWLRRLSLQQTAIAWIVGFVVLIWIVARGARRRGAQTEQLPEDEALPCLQTLLSTLEKAGHPRRGEEAIERLAARLSDRQGGPAPPAVRGAPVRQHRRRGAP